MEEKKRAFTIFSYSCISLEIFQGESWFFHSSCYLSPLIPSFYCFSHILHQILIFVIFLLSFWLCNTQILLSFCYSWRGWRKETQLKSITSNNDNKNWNHDIDFIFGGKNSEKKKKVSPLCQNMIGSSWAFLRWRVDSRASHFISILNELEELLINLSPFNEFFIALNCSR